MAGTALDQGLFVGFALVVQGVLVAFFAARKWNFDLVERYGWFVYALGVPAGLLAGWYIGRSLPWYFFLGLLVFVIWAIYGYWADIYSRLSWRRPVLWRVLIPYIALYLIWQFALWIPLWYIGLVFWWIYTVLYAVSTILNIISH